MASKLPITKTPAEQEYVRRALKQCEKSQRAIATSIGRNVSNVTRFIAGSQFPDETIKKVYASGLVTRPTPVDLEKIEGDLAAREERQEIESRRIDELEPHPANADIYGDSADKELVKSVKEKGILTPLLVTRSGMIISGHRRLDAAKRAGLDRVPVTVNDTQDLLKIEEMLIAANKQRQKTKEQIAREYTRLKEIEAERARQRMTAGKSDPVQNSAQGQERGAARKIAAQKLGISHDTAEKASKVVKKIDELRDDGKEEDAEELRQVLNEKSINAAYKKISPPKKSPLKEKSCKPGHECPEYKNIVEVSRQEIDRLNRKIRCLVLQLEMKTAPITQGEVSTVEKLEKIINKNQ